MASRNIQYKGSFDVSQILASFKQIRDEAAKSNISDKLLGGYDKELEKVEKLTTQILAAQSRGLTDNQSIKEFARLVSQLEKQYGILNVKAQAFTDAANYKTETAEIKQYSTQLKTLIDRQKSLEKSARDYIDANSDSLKLSKEESKALKQSISDAQAYKDVLDEIVQKRIDAAKQKIADRSLSTTGGSQKYAEITGQTTNFTLSAADKKGRDTSRKSLVGRNGQFDETKAITVANQEYNRILEDSIVNNRTAEDALQEMIKTMRAYKLELGDTEEVQKKFAQDLASIKDAAWENHGNLTGNDKGAFTRVEHKVDAIKSNASGLYNNVSVVQNTQVGQTIDQVNRQKIKSETEYNRQVEQTISLQQKLKQQANDTAESIISGEKAEIAESQKNLEIKNTIEDSFNKIGQGAKQILSVTTAWRSLRNVIRNTFNDVKALDKSFASIAMVTEYSVKDMWQQYGQYAEMANRLGQSTQSVVEASGLYYQQGLKTNEVLKLTEETMKLATLAGLDFKEATSQMTAALRAFHMDMSEGAHVTDVYAEVAAHAAVDVQGLSEAMSATAAIANSAGMSFENTTAMLATMVEATQEAPKNLGTAMKTIIARFTELKENVAGTADSEFDDLDYNKVDKALKSVGVSLKDATGQFRNMDEVFLELSSKWNTLDRNSQRYIATIAAGSRQQSRFIALMENYERTMELVDVAQNSAGRSSQQFAKYQDTVEYRLNKIKNSWEQFRTSLLDSDAYKGALDAFSGFLDKLNNTSVTGLTALAGTWLTFGRKAIGGAINGWSNLGSGLVNKIAGGQDKESFKAQWIQDNQYNYIQNGNLDEQAMDQALEKTWKLQEQKIAIKSKAIGNIISTGITTAITTGLTIDDPITAGLTASATSAVSLMPTFIQLGQQIGGPMGTAIGVGASIGIGAISGLISWFRKLKQAEKEATPEYQVKKLKKEVEALNEQLDHQRQDLKNSQNEKKDLESILSDYELLKNKIVKTEDEQERYNNLIKTITNDYPELISYYDEETQQLKLQTKLIKDKIEQNEKLQKQQANIVAVTSLSKIDTQKALSRNQAQVDFKKQLEKAGYKQLSDDNKIQNVIETGFDPRKVSKYSIEDISSLAAQSGYDTNKMSSLLQDQVKLGLITNEELKSILSTTESIAGRYNNDQDFNEYQRVALEKINNLEEYKDYSARDKELLSYQMASHMTEKNQLNTIFNELGSMVETGGLYEIYKEAPKYEDLSAEGLKFLEKYQISEEQYTAAIKNKATAVENLTKLIKNQIVAEQLLQNTEEEKKSASNINNSLDEVNFGNYSDRLKSLSSTYTDPGTKKYLEEYQKQFDDFKQRLDEIGIKEIDIFQELSKEEVEVQSEIVSDLTKTFGKTDNLGKVYKNLVTSIQKEGIPKEIQKSLLSFNPNDLEGQTKEDAKNTLKQLFTDAINSGEITEEAANNTIDSYLSAIQNSGINNFSITSAVGIDTFIEKASKKYKDTVTNYKTAIDTINSNISNGFIDFLDKDKIEEAISSLKLEPSEYLFTDTKGNYQIDVEKLNQDVQNQLTDEKSITNELQEQVQEGINQLTQKKNMLNAIINEYKISDNRLTQERAITKEYALQKQFKDNLNTDKTWADIAKEFDSNWKQNDTMILSQDDIVKMEEQIKTIDTQIQNLRNKANDPKAIEELKKERLAAVNAITNIYKTNTKALEDFEKEKNKAYEDWVSKSRAVADAQKSLAKAIETVAEKQKELKATIEGTNWKSSIDGMYNYNIALDFLTKQTERAKKDLEKASTIDAAKRNFAVYGQGLLDQKAQLQAQNQVYRTAYNNIGRVYNNDVAKLIKSFEDSGQMKFNLADYLVFDEKTGTKINMNALQKAKMPEALKKWIETQGQKANEYLTKIWDNDDKVKQLNEEFIEHQRQALDGYVELQDKMIEVLREKYQKQVDDLRTKYEAMNEADDQYLNALQKNIDKQRKLRDQERSWNDLENKERKLALLRRDTSRGNAVEVRSLEKEVQDDRTSILDSAVDDIIEKLREFYELQKEQRELEITYQETLIDDVALMKEATEALQKIQTSDELVNWWKENVADMEKMSDEKLLQEKQDWEKLFNKKTQYVASVDETVLKSIQNSEKNLKDVADKTEEIVRTTSEGITELASKSLEEAGNEYREAIKKAKEALADAVDAVAKQKEALQAAINAANEAKKAFDDIAAQYKEALSKNTQSAYVVIDSNGNKKAYDDHAAAVRSIESLPQNERTRTIDQQSIQSKDITKTDTTPFSNTGNLSQNWGGNKTLIIGQHGSTLKAFTSDDELAKHNQSNYKTAYTKIGQAEISENVDHGVLEYNKNSGKWTLLVSYKKLEEAEKYFKQYAPSSMASTADKDKYKKNHVAFADGGLVNFTGPAWVDGSRSRPEAFLSAEDTRRIGEAARILADLPILSQPVNQEQLPTTTIGDTTIQIDVHVDSIASDYDLDEAMNKVEQRIVEAAKYTGSNVILKKR